MTSSQKSWNMRAIQLDLARQPETPAFIRGLIDQTSSLGYNTLVLYLEGRIKTASFSFMRRPDFYTPDDMRRLVDYAGRKKMQVVPVVSMFGHADIFLECPELEPLAELRSGRQGRFSSHKHVFCPSEPRTRAFLEQYVSEVAELFPSPYFHAGFDEVWDIGYCDACRKRLKKETQADLFAQHLHACHDIVTRKLGKRMMIWDDMFDLYPQALDPLPRDVILCAWQYDALVEMPSGHCGGPRQDKLRDYAAMGFDALFAPTAFSLRNVESFTQYAATRPAMGALLTTWEMERSFLYDDYACVILAGKLWQGKGHARTVVEDAIRQATGLQDDAALTLLRAVMSVRDISLPASPMRYLTGPLGDGEYQRQAVVLAAMDLLRHQKHDAKHVNPITPLQKKVVEDVLVCLEHEAIFFELRQYFMDLYAPAMGEPAVADLPKRQQAILKRLTRVKEARLRQWRRERRGLPDAHVHRYFDGVLNMLHDAPGQAQQAQGMLRLRLHRALSFITCQVQWKHQRPFESLAPVRISHQPDRGQTGWYMLPLTSTGTPARLRIQAHGLVSAELMYADVLTREGSRFVPDAVVQTQGQVFQPEAMLEDGSDWAQLGLGEQHAREKFLQPALAQAKHSITCTLRPS